MEVMPTEVDRFGPRQDFRLGHHRQKSVPISDLIFNPSTKGLYTNDRNREDTKLRQRTSPTERRIEYIRADDKRIKEVMLATLKKALEDLAEEVCNKFGYFDTIYVSTFRGMFKCVACSPWLRLTNLVFRRPAVLDFWMLTLVRSNLYR